MSHLRAVSLMIVVTLLWSSAGVVTRHLDSAQSFEVTFWRSFFTALSLAIALTWLRGPGLWSRLLRSSWPIWLSGLCWATMFTAFMMAITLTTVANALITLAVGPLVTALFGRIFLRHHLPLVTWLAIALAGIGIAWMFAQTGDATISLVGTLVALACPIAGAANFTILQHVGLDQAQAADGAVEQDMLPTVLIGASISALVTLPFALPFQASGHDLGLLALLGALQLALPCLLLVRLSRELSAPEISLLAQLEVIFGVTWAWLWAGEVPSSNTLIGGLLVLGALLTNELARLIQVERCRRRTAH